MVSIKSELVSFQNDVVFFDKNYEELKKKFSNKFVAIKNEDVVASGKQIDKVMKQIKQKKLNPSLIFIEFIHKNKVQYLL